MKIPSNAPDALSQLRQAHHDKGVHNHGVREQAKPFYDALTSGNVLKEAKLKLRLAVDPSSRRAMDALWPLLFQSAAGEGDRHAKLQAWTTENKGLLGWMSPQAQKMLASLANGGARAQQIDAAVQQANDALAAAFGSKAAMETPGAKRAVQSFTLEASTQGAVAAALPADIDKMASKVRTLLHPGAREALASLKQALGDPAATNTQRRDFLQGWMQSHPRLTGALDQGILGQMRKDLSVADWSDQNYARAEQSLRDALEQAGR
jgi:hypothetical protein